MARDNLKEERGRQRVIKQGENLIKNQGVMKDKKKIDFLKQGELILDKMDKLYDRTVKEEITPQEADRESRKLNRQLNDLQKKYKNSKNLLKGGKKQ